MKLVSAIRRQTVTLIAALGLVACGSAGSEDAANPQMISDAERAISDIVLGNTGAPLTMIEYASWTCGHCLQYHEDIMPILLDEYIEQGKLRLVFREFPTAPANVSVAGFAIARCAGPDKYFDVLDELFKRQSAIISLIRNGGQVRAALIQIGLNNGIPNEETIEACLADNDILRAISTSIARGDAQGVRATPTIFLNGEQLVGSNWRSPDAMRTILDDALTESGDNL
ncbi:MAG: hypothetical protein CME93_07580 [Hyphomonadaceae bacterium]|nr:hypothetical protein [Hyphomonadaceae bacterium]OUX93303.1 MAG: hypothetical protein CBB77_09630 [Hyphomonas sp. TMED17]CAI8346568.1 MAG: Disulfide bond formation protein D [Hyphomonas sp. TMED17]